MKTFTKTRCEKKEIENYKMAYEIYSKGKFELFYIPKFIEERGRELIVEHIEGFKYKWSEYKEQAGYGGEGIPTNTVDKIIRLIEEAPCFNGDLQFRNLIFFDNKIAVIDWEQFLYPTEITKVSALAYIYLMMFNNKEWQRDFLNKVSDIVSFDYFKLQAIRHLNLFISFWKNGSDIKDEMEKQLEFIESKEFKLYYYNIKPEEIGYQVFEDINIFTKKHSNSLEKLKAIAIDDYIRGRVLDIGCSSGYFSFHCAKNGAVKVLGIDNGKSVLNTANKLKKYYDLNKKVMFDNIDFMKINVEVEFDLILCLSMLHYIENKKAFLDKVYNVLSSNGFFVLEVPVGEEKIWDIEPKRYFITEEQMNNLLSEKFIIVYSGKSNLSDRKVYHLRKKNEI